MALSKKPATGMPGSVFDQITRSQKTENLACLREPMGNRQLSSIVNVGLMAWTRAMYALART